MHFFHRVVDRGILSHIFEFWTVLGSQGCREKKIQNDISMLHLRTISLCFHGQNFFHQYFFQKFVTVSPIRDSIYGGCLVQTLVNETRRIFSSAIVCLFALGLKDKCYYCLMILAVLTEVPRARYLVISWV